VLPFVSKRRFLKLRRNVMHEMKELATARHQKLAEHRKYTEAEQNLSSTVIKHETHLFFNTTRVQTKAVWKTRKELWFSIFWLPISAELYVFNLK